MVDALASAQGSLSLLTALLLELPGVVTFKVDHANAGESFLLIEYIAEGDIRVGLFSISDGVTSVVGLADGSATEEV